MLHDILQATNYVRARAGARGQTWLWSCGSSSSRGSAQDQSPWGTALLLFLGAGGGRQCSHCLV